MKEITQQNLFGDIKGFPIEIIEKMLKHQEKQTGKRDISVFIRNKKADVKHGGFTWNQTEEGIDFWSQTMSKNFTPFYKKYGEKPIIYDPPKKMIVSDSLPFEKYDVIEREVVFYKPGVGYYAKALNPNDKRLYHWNYAKEIPKDEVFELTIELPIELTIEKIARRFNIPIDQVRII